MSLNHSWHFYGHFLKGDLSFCIKASSHQVVTGLNGLIKTTPEYVSGQILSSVKLFSFLFFLYSV